MNRNHPVRQMLDAAARGHRPTRSELAAFEALGVEGVPGSWVRKKVAEAATAINATRAGGYLLEARRQAAEAAEEIIEKVGEPEPVAEQDLPDDPRALAAIVADSAPADPDDPEHPQNLAAKISRDRMY